MNKAKGFLNCGFARWIVWLRQSAPLHETGGESNERGYTAVEAAVAAVLLSVVLVPLASFVTYTALESRADTYAEALRLAEAYAEALVVQDGQLRSISLDTPSPSSSSAPLFPLDLRGENSRLPQNAAFEVGRFTVQRMVETTNPRAGSSEAGLARVRIAVIHRRTDRRVCALERTFFLAAQPDAP